jgi:hypothetical protein
VTGATLLDVVLLAGAPPQAPDGDRPPPGALVTAGRRSVAVLEFRAGAPQLANLADRLAAQLARATSLHVVTPVEARRRLGARIDAQVARCEGEPGCFAELGTPLGVSEVIVVGISHLGDTVLALQRILVPGGRVSARDALSLPPGEDPSTEALLGFLRRLLPPEDFVRWGEIRIETEERGAKVFLDGALRGETPLRASLRVQAPQRYDLRVTKPGRVDFTARIDVPPDARVEVRPTLTLKPEATAWYQRWWAWAIVGGIAASAAVAVAASGSSDGRVDVIVRPPPPRP